MESLKKEKTWRIKIDDLELLLTKEEHKVVDEKIRWKVVRADNNFEFGYVSSYETSDGRWMGANFIRFRMWRFRFKIRNDLGKSFISGEVPTRAEALMILALVIKG